MFSKYIAGLIWCNVSQGKKSRSYGQGNNPRFYALSKNYPQQYGFSDNPENHKKISLAALLSHKYDNLVLITDKLCSSNTKDQTHWLCVIENGSVVNTGTLLSDGKVNLFINKKYLVDDIDVNYSGDQLCTANELITILHYLIARAKLQSQPFLLHADLGNDHILSSIKEGYSVHSINLAEELRSLRKYETSSRLINHKAKKVRRIILSVSAAIGLAICVHALFGTSSNDQDIENAQLQQRIKAQQEKGLIQQKSTYQNLLAQSWAYNNTLKMQCLLNKVPVLIDGWLLNGYGYHLIKNEFVLILNYNRLEYGLIDAILNFKFDKFTVLKTDVKEHENVVDVFLQIPSAICKAESATQYKDKGKEQSIIGLVADLQRLSLNYRVSKKIENKTFNKSYYEIEISGNDYSQFISYMNFTREYHQLILNDFSALTQLGESGDWHAKTILYV
jgi:hypothetical protein